MKPLASKYFLFTSLILLTALTLRASPFNDRMDLIHRGMSARSAVTILGQPSKVTAGPNGSVYFDYPSEDGVWRVAIMEGRVASIDKP